MAAGIGSRISLVIDQERKYPMEKNYINCENFKKRIIELCLKSGLSDFPVKRRDQLVLLKSIAILFNPNHQYTEMEVNQRITSWLKDMERFFQWDFMMLRRRLVDEKFLTRKPDGSGYCLCPPGPAEVVFDPAIDGLDICQVIREGEESIARRKQEYLQQQKDSLIN
jgi:hypothetical protein